MRSILRRRPSPAFVLASIALLVALGGTSVAAVQATVPKNGVGSAQLKENAVTSAKIKNAAVTSAKLASNAVTSAKLANNAVTSAKLASNAVTSAKIAAGAVTSGKLGDGAVTTASIANDAVTNAKIANNAITSAQVQNGSLVAADFAAGQLPQGPPGQAGPQGVPGPAGPPGLTAIQIVSITSDNGGDNTGATATCPSGKKLIGGGAGISGTGQAHAYLGESAPNTSNGWHAVGRNDDDVEAAGPPFDDWTLTVYAICANAS